MCGKQTTDGDTAQVGSELAEHLKVPHAANVRDVDIDGDKIRYVSNLDNKIVTARITTPCLLCVDGEVNTPRLPSFKRKMQYGDCADLIQIITFNDLVDRDESHYGLKGSPTQVERIFNPDKKTEKEIIKEGNLADKMYEILKNRKFV